MDQGQTDVALRATEVPMLEPEIVRQIRAASLAQAAPGATNRGAGPAED
jgi:hypothetical protein